jgi:hypothetical protein
MVGIQLSLYFIKEKGLLDFATNTTLSVQGFLNYGGNTPVPVVCSQRISKAAR